MPVGTHGASAIGAATLFDEPIGVADIQGKIAPPGWGYDCMVGALANLGHTVSDQAVGNILRRHGIAPAPQRGRTMSWKDFLAAHIRVLAGGDFFTVEVLEWCGLVTYILFFLTWKRGGSPLGITRYPDGEWIEQIAGSATEESWGLSVSTPSARPR